MSKGQVCTHLQTQRSRGKQELTGQPVIWGASSSARDPVSKNKEDSDYGRHLTLASILYTHLHIHTYVHVGMCVCMQASMRAHTHHVNTYSHIHIQVKQGFPLKGKPT